MSITLTKRKQGENNHENNSSDNDNNNDNDDKMNDHLANERTFLAWTRTALNIFTVGCAIGRFGGTGNSQSTSLTSPNAQKKPLIAGIILAIIGIICLVYGIWRFFRTHRQIKRQRDLNGPEIIGPILSVLVLMVALIAVLIIFFII